MLYIFCIFISEKSTQSTYVREERMEIDEEIEYIYFVNDLRELMSRSTNLLTAHFTYYFCLFSSSFLSLCVNQGHFLSDHSFFYRQFHNSQILFLTLDASKAEMYLFCVHKKSSRDNWDYLIEFPFFVTPFRRPNDDYYEHDTRSTKREKWENIWNGGSTNFLAIFFTSSSEFASFSLWMKWNKMFHKIVEVDVWKNLREVHKIY